MGDFGLASGVMAEALALGDSKFVGGGRFGKTAEAVGGFGWREITPLKRGVNERKTIRIFICGDRRDACPT